MNLSTMRAAPGAGEVKPAQGGGRLPPVGGRQFIAEAMVLAVLSMGLAVLGGYLPADCERGGGPVAATIRRRRVGDVRHPGGGDAGHRLVSGSYPAFVLSAFRPADTLRSRAVGGRGGVLFRKVLIVFQLTVSVGLILCTLVVARQLRYIQDMDLGLNRHQVVKSCSTTRG